MAYSPLAERVDSDTRMRLQMQAVLSSQPAQRAAHMAGATVGMPASAAGYGAWTTAAAVGALHSPGVLMGGLFDAANGGGGLRVQGPTTNFQPLQTGGTGMAPWVAQQLFSQVEGRIGGGMNGYDTKRIGQELLPSMSNRGLMSGVTAQQTTDSAGQVTGLDASAGKMLTTKISAATETLAAMRDVFGDRHMGELAKQAEIITGMTFDASSADKLKKMGAQIRKITDVAQAMGTNAQELMDFTQRLGTGIAQDLMAGGMNATSASRAGSALAIDNIGAVAGTKQNYNQMRALLPNGADMPDITDQEFGEAARSRVAKGAAAPGSQQFVALQNVMLRNPNLSAQQKAKMQSMLSGFGAAKDKESWAQGVDGYLKSAIGTDSAEISKVYGLGDVGQEGMSKWNSEFLAHSGVNKEAIQNLMQRGRLVGVLKKEQMGEGMEKLADTFFSSFDANTQRGMLDAADQGKFKEYVDKNNLAQFLPAGVSMSQFSGQLSGENRKALRGLMAVGADSAEAQAITNRQVNAGIAAGTNSAQADRIVNGRNYKSGSSDFVQGVEGVLGLRDANNPIDQMDVAFRDAELRKGLLNTHINEKGGLSINAQGAAQLQKTTGMNLFTELGVKEGDYNALATALGTNKFQKVAGKFQSEKGGNTQLVSALDMSITQVGAAYDSNGNFTNLNDKNINELLKANGLSAADFGIAGADNSTILKGLTEGHSGGTGMDLMRRALKGRGAHDRLKATNLVWANSDTLEGASQLLQNSNKAAVPARRMFSGSTDDSILGGGAEMRDVALPSGEVVTGGNFAGSLGYKGSGTRSTDVKSNAIDPSGSNAMAARSATTNGVMHVEQLIIKNVTMPGTGLAGAGQPNV